MESSFTEQYLTDNGDASDSPEIPGKKFDYWSDSLNLIREKTQRGSSQVAQTYYNTYLSTRFDLSDDEEMDLLKQSQQDNFNGVDKDVENLYKSAPWGVRIVSDATEMLPGIGATYAQGLAVGTASAAASGPLAAGATAVGSAVGSPLIGAAAGTAVEGISFGTGFTTGSVSSVWTQSYGELYGELRMNGVSRDTARALASTFGTINAGLEYIGLKALSKLGGKALTEGTRKQLQQAINNKVTKRLEKNVMARLGVAYLEEVFTESATEGAQSFVSNRADAIAAIIERGDPQKWNSWGTAIEDSKEAFLTAFGASLVLGAGTGAAGYTLGRAKGATENKLAEPEMREILEQLKSLSPSELMARAKDALEDQPFPWEGEQSGSDTIQYAEDGQVFRVSISNTDNGGASEEAGAPESSVAALSESPLGSSVAVDSTEAGASLTGTETTGTTATDESIAKTVAQAVSETPEEAQAIEEALDVLFEESENGNTATEPQQQAATDTGSPQQQTAPANGKPKGQPIAPVMEHTELTPVEVQARKNQIAADLRILKKEQKRLESEFNKKEKLGHKTDNVLTRLEKLLDLQEQLQTEQELLDSGLLTREEVSKSYGKQRMSSIGKLIDRIKASGDRLVKQKQKYENKIAATAKAAFQKGRTAEQRTIRALQNQLIQAINAATKDKNIRTKLKNMVNKVTTLEQFNKAATNIQKELYRLEQQNIKKAEKQAKDKLLGQIERLLSRGKVKMQNGHPVSRLDADTIARLRAFKRFVKDANAARQVIADFLLQHGAALQTGQLHTIPTDELQDYQTAVMAHDLENRTPMELSIIAGNLAQWIQDGRDAVTAKKDALRQQRADERAMARDSVGVHNHEETEGVPGIKEKVRQVWESAKSGILSWDTLLEFITPNDAGHVLRLLLDPTHAKRTQYAAVNTIKMGLLDKLQRALRAAGFKKNIQHKITEDSDAQYRIRYMNQAGQMKDATYTKAQIIDIAMKMMDVTLHNAMKAIDTGNAWTFTGEAPPGQSFEEVISALITPEDKVVIDALLEFYQEYHPRINAKYRDKYGVDLPTQQNYSPLQRTGYDVDPGEGNEGLLFSSLLPGAAKTRTDNLFKIVAGNAYNVANKHVDQWEHFLAFDDLIGTMRNIMSDAPLRKTIADRHGTGTLEVIDRYINRFIRNDPMPQSESHPFFAALRRDISRSALGFKPAYQALTQLTSGLALWHGYGVREILNGAIEMARHLPETEKAFRDSPIMQHRFRSGASFDLSQAMRREGLFGAMLAKFTGVEAPTLTPAQYGLLSRIMFAGIRYGDAGVSRLFGGPVYWAEKAKGKTDEQAMMEVERLVETTQQGDSVDQMPDVFAKNPMVYTLFGMFRLQPLQLYTHSMIAVRDFANAKKNSPEAFMRLGKELASLWVVSGLFFGGVKTLPQLFAPATDDEDRGKEAITELASSAILGPVNGVPLFGDVIEAAWFTLCKPMIGVDMDYKTYFQGKNLVYQTFWENPAQAVKAWAKLWDAGDTTSLSDLNDGETEEELQGKAVLKTARALGPLLGIPQALVNVPTATASALENGDYLGAAYALGGWSPGTVKKRFTESDGTSTLADIGKEKNAPIIDYESFFRDALPIQPEDSPNPSDDYETIFQDGLLEGILEREEETTDD